MHRVFLRNCILSELEEGDRGLRIWLLLQQTPGNDHLGPYVGRSFSISAIVAFFIALNKAFQA